MSGRRWWSAAALLLAIAALVLAVVTAVIRFPDGLSVLVCLLLALVAAWYGVQRRRVARVVGITIAVLLVAGALVLVVLGGRVLENTLVVVAVLGSLIAARRAFAVHVDLPPSPRPEHPVLFYNPRSGGGKAQRFHLPREARRRGIEPIELRPGVDLERLVRDAVFDGADALAMAGGDGSQAIVAKIAAETGLPYACIPAGTRNHFALDLGVDRDDVVGALDAFVDGGEREVDLAEVNGRVFVNNVSLGLYADAVQQPGYRESKLHTLLDTVPDVLGPDAKPQALSWDNGRAGDSAVAILVSNNPYRLGHALGSGTRPRLNTGELGVAVLAAVNANADRSARRKLEMRQWEAAEFEVEAGAQVAAGIDGEAVLLEPPLRFRIRHRVLRARIAPNHPGASPSALEPEKPWEAIRALTRYALGAAPADVEQHI